MIQLIKKSADAMGSGEGVYYFGKNDIGCSLVVDGDLDTDTIPITYLNLDGDETDAYNSDGEALQLTATNPLIPIYQACKIKVTKGATTNAVGVNIHGMG